MDCNLIQDYQNHSFLAALYQSAVVSWDSDLNDEFGPLSFGLLIDKFTNPGSRNFKGFWDFSYLFVL